MKKTKKTLLLIGFIVCSSLLSACGGLHSSNTICAKNLITDKCITIPIDVYNYADTGNFSNFTTHLSFSELKKELESTDAVNTAINIYHTPSTGYMKLETASGDFYVKYNSYNDGENYYSLFADVGKAEEFGEYIYIPFYMLEEFPNSDYPANATPFEGDVYYKEFFDINDFAEYYRDKEIYDVEKLNDTALLITDKSNSYSFTIKLFDEGMFVLNEK